MTGAAPRWSEEEIATLKRLIAGGEPMTAISRKLGRTPSACRRQCQTQHLILGRAPRLRLSRVPMPVSDEEWQPRPPPREYPPDCCTWMEGHRPHWVRCENKVFRKSAWCHTHYCRVYSYRRDTEYVKA
jgi:hypothetical protein